MKALSREAFFGISGALLLAGCEGSTFMGGRSSNDASRKALGTNVLPCANGCSDPTPTPYKYSVTATTNTGRTGIAKYNEVTSVVSSGTDTNNSALFSGTIAASFNADNSINQLHVVAPTFSGAPKSISAGITLPASLPNNGAFTSTDTNGVKHTVSISSSGTAITVVDSFVLNGNTWTFTASSPDGNAVTVKWVTATSTGSFTLQLPALACSIHNPVHVAAAKTLHDDFVRFRDGEEVAYVLCCVCIQRQSDLGFQIGAVSGGLGVLAGATGIGLPAVPFFESYGAMCAIYGGAMGIAHSLICHS